MPILHGIDKSTWNEVSDYRLLPPLKFIASQVGVTARNGWRDKNILVADDQYRRNIDNERALGLKNLIHYYVGVNVPWKEQVAWLMKQIGPLPFGEAIMFDNEYGHLLELGWPSVNAMMNETEQLIQRPVWHYGELFMHQDSPARPKWAASYQSNEAVMQARYPYQNVGLWQYSRTGVISGIAANVDLNQIMDFEVFNSTFGVLKGEEMYWQALPEGVATFRVGGGTAFWIDGSAGPPPELVGQVIQKVGLAAFKKLVLVGALPVGDSLHTWKASDFLAHITGPIPLPNPPSTTVPPHNHTLTFKLD